MTFYSVSKGTNIYNSWREEKNFQSIFLNYKKKLKKYFFHQSRHEKRKGTSWKGVKKVILFARKRLRFPKF